MAFTQNPKLLRDWEQCPKERPSGRWMTLYATLSPNGDISISRHTHEALGEPDSYLLLFERERMVIGLRPARAAVEKAAYVARDRGQHGGKRIRGYTLCREFGISIPHTVRFHKSHIDHNGVLILDLNETQPGPRARTMPAENGAS